MDQSDADNPKPKRTGGKRAQSPVPKYTLKETLKVAQTIEDANAGQPLPPVETAVAMDFSPRNSKFEQITSASIKYGLTTGSSRGDVITITPLGQRIVAATSSEDQAAAMLAAALTPETFRGMYDFFKGKKLPESQFLLNTIVREFDIPREHAEKCAEVFAENMRTVGLIVSRNNANYLSTQAKPVVTPAADDDDDHEEPVDEFADDEPTDEAEESGSLPAGSKAPNPPAPPTPTVNRKVFISHGKNTKIVEQVKELLKFGDFEAVVSVDRETTSKPVPDKVMGDMRECGAGIINVGSERKVIDQEGKEHVILNQNVLIEIGAAMALYERRFILLVEKGVTLPSNLQGLYEVRYEGQELGGDATIKLLKAFNDFKS